MKAVSNSRGTQVIASFCLLRWQCHAHQGSKQGLTPEIFLSNTTGKATCAIKELVVLSTFSFSFLTSNAIIFSGKFWCICRIGGHTQPRWQLGWLTSKQQHWHAAGFGMLSQHTRDPELANAWSTRTKRILNHSKPAHGFGNRDSVGQL